MKEVQINERKISKISSLAYMYFTGKNSQIYNGNCCNLYSILNHSEYLAQFFHVINLGTFRFNCVLKPDKPVEAFQKEVMEFFHTFA